MIDIKVYRYYQQGFLTNDYLQNIFIEDLKNKIDYLHMIYCRNFFPSKKDYYKTVKDEYEKLVYKYNELMNK